MDFYVRAFDAFIPIDKERTLAKNDTNRTIIAGYTLEYIFRSGQNASPLNIVQYLPILADIIFIPIGIRVITQIINVFNSNNDKRQPKNQQIFKLFYMYFEYNFFNV